MRPRLAMAIACFGIVHCGDRLEAACKANCDKKAECDPMQDADVKEGCKTGCALSNDAAPSDGCEDAQAAFLECLNEKSCEELAGIACPERLDNANDACGFQ